MATEGVKKIFFAVFEDDHPKVIQPRRPYDAKLVVCPCRAGGRGRSRKWLLKCSDTMATKIQSKPEQLRTLGKINSSTSLEDRRILWTTLVRLPCQRDTSLTST